MVLEAVSLWGRKSLKRTSDDLEKIHDDCHDIKVQASPYRDVRFVLEERFGSSY